MSALTAVFARAPFALGALASLAALVGGWKWG